MRNPVDLTGRRFGKLVAVSPAPAIVSASGRWRTAAWLCRCDCGREEVFSVRRLPHCPSAAARKDVATECSYCHAQRTCQVCAKVFESRLYRATCSEACALQQRRANDLERYYRRVAEDPDYNRKILAKRNERAESDPEYAAHLRALHSAQERRKKAKIKADPVRHESVLAQARARYRRDHQRKRERINARLRERLETMSDAEYEAWLEERRAQYRRYAAERRGTPEGREQYRQYMREFRAQKALRQLLRVGQELLKRSGPS